MFINAEDIVVGKHGGFLDEYDERYVGFIYIEGVDSNDNRDRDKRVVIEVTKTQLEDLKTKIDRFLEGVK